VGFLVVVDLYLVLSVMFTTIVIFHLISGNLPLASNGEKLTMLRFEGRFDTLAICQEETQVLIDKHKSYFEGRGIEFTIEAGECKPVGRDT